MSDRDLYGVVRRALLTERSTFLKEKVGQYTFEVDPRATKGDIKRALEGLFKVKVAKVRTMVVPGKFRRFGRSEGFRSDWKKAIVTLKPGQKIDFTEEVA